MTRKGRAPRGLLAVVGPGLAVCLLGADAAAQAAPDSPWYLERGTVVRADPTPEPVTETARLLASLLRDGGVPGFYDGQFVSLAGRGEQLAAIIRDSGLHHVLRVMAVMALQEVESGKRVADVLDPLVLPADEEFGIDFFNWQRSADLDDPAWVARLRQADLSQHARFSLAKDGQPARVMEKIRVMEVFVQRNLALLLDPSVRSETARFGDVAWGRRVIFDIGYHFQQFDDFQHAAEWFGKLCEHLPGHRETTMAHYNLACIAALRGRADEAVDHLRRAYAVGFTDVAWMEEDGDLQTLRHRPDFQALAAAMRNEAPPLDGQDPQRPEEAVGGLEGLGAAGDGRNP